MAFVKISEMVGAVNKANGVQQPMLMIRSSWILVTLKTIHVVVLGFCSMQVRAEDTATFFFPEDGIVVEWVADVVLATNKQRYEC
jgi:hypothetical protein